jgi:hypothetical protein
MVGPINKVLVVVEPLRCVVVVIVFAVQLLVAAVVPVSNQAVVEEPVHVSDISVKPPTTTADVKLKSA